MQVHIYSVGAARREGPFDLWTLSPAVRRKYHMQMSLDTKRLSSTERDANLACCFLVVYYSLL